MVSKSSASFQVIEEGEEQKEEQQPSISSSNADEQPPVIGGGTEMGEAIMEMIRPAVQNLDNQVKCTRKSQIMLASHIDELSKSEFNSQYEIVKDNQQRNKRSPPTFWGGKRLIIPVFAGSFALMDRFKGEKQANQKEITKNETNIVEQEKIEGKQEQQNIFIKINQILMKSPQQSNHNIGKDMLEMVTAG
uniref:Uncharacterized protein n=1 Tax=Meloidogyne javanica TaxID=6303 RepID=A0A915MS47_MELJA